MTESVVLKTPYRTVRLVNVTLTENTRVVEVCQMEGVLMIKVPVSALHVLTTEW